MDDNKANLNIDEILKNNEETLEKLKKAEERSNKFEAEFRRLYAMSSKFKALERQKQLDDMAISGLKSIKADSTKEILKLNQRINTLKLDLLAERQLRRTHQMSLHEFDPQNGDYDMASVDVGERDTSSVAAVNGNGDSDRPLIMLNESSQIVNKSFWNLNCEAAPATTETPSSSQTKPHIYPSKIQKVGKDPRDKFLLLRTQRTAWSNDNTSSGFQFAAPIRTDGPSTSTASSSAQSTVPKFGEGMLRPFVPPAKSSTGVTASFNFNTNSPDFSTAAAAPIMFGQSTITAPTIPFNTLSFVVRARQPNITPFGPKSSDR